MTLSFEGELLADAQTQHPAAIMRMLHYPGIPVENVKEENPGIGAHTGKSRQVQQQPR